MSAHRRAAPKAALAVLLLLAAACAHAADQIVTGTLRSTALIVGRDIARLAGAPAGLELEVLSTNGSSDNANRLKRDPATRLGLIQGDVLQAYVDEGARGNAEAAQMARSLRVVMPLYREEIHFVVRADSPLRTISEIQDQRINVGLIGGGAALTMTALYRQMFGVPLSSYRTSFLKDEDALLHLVDERDIDVVVVVGGQPVPLFARMRPEARALLRLLKFDARDSTMAGVTGNYSEAGIRAASYPQWLTEDVPTLATRTLLATYDLDAPEARQALTRLAYSLCDNFERLQAEGHPKWKEASLALPSLPPGWNYYAPTQAALARCVTQRRQDALAAVSASAASEAAAAARAAELAAPRAQPPSSPASATAAYQPAPAPAPAPALHNKPRREPRPPQGASAAHERVSHEDRSDLFLRPAARSRLRSLA
jgi:TRAP transporter TAXI family solute receptor